MKLLVVAPLHFAGAVCASLLLRCVKKQAANALVHLAAEEALQAVFQSSPYIDKLLPFAVSVADEDYDYVIDLSGRDVRVKGSSELQHLAPKRLWFSRPHKAVQYLSAVQSLSITNDEQGLNFFVPEAAQVKPADVPVAHSAGFVAVVVSAAYPANVIKTLHLFCERLQHPLVLIGDEDASETAARLRWPDPIKIYNACGKFSRLETADLVRRSKLLITGEAAWMQVAAAFQKKIVAISNKELQQGYAPPLYATHFLQQQTTPPFHLLHRTLLPSNKTGGGQADELMQAVQRFLS